MTDNTEVIPLAWFVGLSVIKFVLEPAFPVIPPPLARQCEAGEVNLSFVELGLSTRQFGRIIG